MTYDRCALGVRRGPSLLIENALAHYYDSVQEALNALSRQPDVTSSEEFSPGSELPELTPEVRGYLSASDIARTALPSYHGKRLALLDLTRNPATMTTKTFASLVIVARAVRYIRSTGERVTIITPSSANKAIALRDAVLRAIKAGLVTPEELNATVIVPAGSVPKLRSTELFADRDLRSRNPIAVYHGDEPGAVKALARGVIEEHAADLARSAGTNLWYTLQLENYLAADVVRAHAEAEFFPASSETPRLHVHAVSSAYGLLGHAFGRSLLDEATRQQSPLPHYLLVQHLGAPDMVLSLYHSSTDSSLVPAYTYDRESGLYRQHQDPHFPAVTFAPDENLDSTFYTRNPPTSTRMNALIHEGGGGGVVVSLAECLERYGQVRGMLREGGVTLPADPRQLREWSLVMAVTGVLNAIDRDLVSEDDILIHGSGSYSISDFTSLPSNVLHSADDVPSLRDIVFKASSR